MTGGLLQLVALGAQDLYLSGIGILLEKNKIMRRLLTTGLSMIHSIFETALKSMSVNDFRNILFGSLY